LFSAQEIKKPLSSALHNTGGLVGFLAVYDLLRTACIRFFGSQTGFFCQLPPYISICFALCKNFTCFRDKLHKTRSKSGFF
jgi:hypothetical protein